MNAGRRDLLRAGASAGAIALAGCSTILSPSGGTDDPGYAQWLYRPDPVAYFPDVEEAAVALGFEYTEPERIVERKGAFVGSGMTEREFETSYEDRYGMYGVTGTDVVRWMRTSGGIDDRSRIRRIFVDGMAATFDGEQVRSRARDGASGSQTYEGWDVYESADSVTGVSDRHVFRVYAHSSGEAAGGDRSLVGILEDVLDVVDGRREPYRSEDFEAFADAMDDGSHATANLFEAERDRPFPGTLAIGKVGLDAADRRLRFGALFPDRESASPDAARRKWEDSFEELESVERAGRAVVATGTADPSTWLE